MELGKELVQEIKRYLEQVAAHLRGLPQDEKQDILENLERHIHDALSRRAEGRPTLAELRAVLAEMDPPESYGRTDEDTAKPPPVARPIKPSAEPPRLYGDNPALIRASVRAAIIHALLPLGLVAFLVYEVPKARTMFAEMDIELPWMTLFVIYFSDFLKHYWYTLVVPAMFLLVADGVIYFLLRRRGWKIAGGLWYAVVLLVECACVGFCYIGIILPLKTLMDCMSG